MHAYIYSFTYSLQPSVHVRGEEPHIRKEEEPKSRMRIGGHFMGHSMVEEEDRANSRERGQRVGL